MRVFRETKIVLKGETALQLQQLAEKAKNVGLLHFLVQDAGHTQVRPNIVWQPTL
jgi:peptidyl-tRNA hydrolase